MENWNKLINSLLAVYDLALPFYIPAVCYATIELFIVIVY